MQKHRPLKNGDHMKQLPFLFALSAATLFTAEVSAIDQWSISFEELQKPLQKPAEKARSLVWRSAEAAVNDHNTLCSAYLLPDDLQEIIARLWYKQNYEALLNQAFNESSTPSTFSNLNKIASLAVLTNGDIIAGHLDNTAKILDPSTKDIIYNLVGHQGLITAFAELNNGDIATASLDGTVKIWGPSTGQLKKTINCRQGPLSSVIALKNGDIATRGKDNIAKIWNPSTGQLRHTLIPDTNSSVTAIAALQNYLATADFDGTVHIWDASTGQLKFTTSAHKDAIRSLVVLSDDTIATGSSDGTVCIWDPLTGQLKQKIDTIPLVNDIVALPNGDIAIAHFLSLDIFDPSTAKLRQKINDANRSSFVQSLAVLKNGDLLALYNDRNAGVWPITTAIKNFFPNANAITIHDICKLDGDLHVEKMKTTKSGPKEKM